MIVAGARCAIAVHCTRHLFIPSAWNMLAQALQ
jgi:hypothetical protein